MQPSSSSTVNAKECPEESNLLRTIINWNLLFDKSYVLSDTIFELLNFRYDTTHHQQNKTLEILIERDSIPNLKYSTCSKQEIQKWTEFNSINTISHQKLTQIFKDPYIISGGVDNYKRLKELSGKDGIINMSDIYYSPDFEVALIGLEILCGWSCGQNQIRMYKRKENKWILEMNYIISEN